ncbi:MAG TPA: four helix bundle protein [Longimicrobium sp.]|nr:four helix bundle protein [Longimicrobium sp.]
MPCTSSTRRRASTPGTRRTSSSSGRTTNRGQGTGDRGQQADWDVTGIGSHRDLMVWRKAMDLAVEVYRLSRSFPRDEIYRLTSQLTRAVASVPANIAEGHAHASTREYANFLSIAKGSLMETETFLMLSVRLGYLTAESAAPALSLVTEISKMLTSLRSRLQ